MFKIFSSLFYLAKKTQNLNCVYYNWIVRQSKKIPLKVIVEYRGLG